MTTRALLVGAALLYGAALLDGAAPLDGQSSPRAGMLEQDGWAALKGGNAVAAAASFREAIALDPKNAWLRLGA